MTESKYEDAIISDVKTEVADALRMDADLTNAVGLEEDEPDFIAIAEVVVNRLTKTGVQFYMGDPLGPEETVSLSRMIVDELADNYMTTTTMGTVERAEFVKHRIATNDEMDKFVTAMINQGILDVLQTLYSFATVMNNSGRMEDGTQPKADYLVKAVPLAAILEMANLYKNGS